MGLLEYLTLDIHGYTIMDTPTPFAIEHRRASIVGIISPDNCVEPLEFHSS